MSMNMPRGVLHVVTLSELGGAQRYLAELAVRQAALGIRVDVATGSPGWLTEQSAFTRVRLIPGLVRPIAPRSDWRALAHLLSVLRLSDYDVVHTHTSKAGVLGRLAARIARIQTVAHTSHGSVLAERLPVHKRTAVFAAEQAATMLTDRLFAVCDSDAKFLRRHLFLSCPIEVMTIVPAYIRQRQFRWRITEDNRWRCVALGNAYWNKGYDVLVRAIALVVPHFPRLALTIVGDGPELETIERIIGELGLQDIVELAGSRRDVEAYLSGAGLFIMSSRKEGLPLALLEAMAAGLPIAATNVGGIADLIGKAVHLVPKDDPVALAAQISRYLADDALRIDAGQRARHAYEAIEAQDRGDRISSMYT